MEIDRATITAEDISAATGAGVRILIVDSGVETTHPSLAGASIACHRLEPRIDGCIDIVPEDGLDVFGHGTAVAAIIRQFAPRAAIDSLRVIGGDLRSASVHVLAGLRWAIQRRYDIINCSFGTPSDQYLADYKQVVDEAFCAGCILVGACNNLDFRRPDYPGSFPTVISTDFGRVEPMELRRRPGQLVEFVAYGEQVRVAWKNGSYRTSSGSSFAAPHAASIVARIRQLHPAWNACEIKAALYRLARDIQP